MLHGAGNDEPAMGGGSLLPQTGDGGSTGGNQFDTGIRVLPVVHCAELFLG